jgi:hypothetical protein
VVRLARGAYSRRTPQPGVWGFGYLETSSVVLRITLLARLLHRRVLRITLIARGTRSGCGHSLGAGRSKSQIGPTSSDLAPYRVYDLIKHQHYHDEKHSVLHRPLHTSFLCSVGRSSPKCSTPIPMPLHPFSISTGDGDPNVDQVCIYVAPLLHFYPRFV